MSAQPKLSAQAHRVMSDGAYTFAMRVVNIIASVGLGILTARLLGPAGKGVYALPMVQAGLVSTVYTGLNSATSYFLLNRSPGRRIVAPMMWASVLLTLLCAIVVAIVAWIARTPWAALPAIASLPAVAAANIVTGYVIGIKRVRFSTTFAVAQTVATFALMCAGLFLISRSPWTAIVAWLVATSAIGLIGVAAVLLHASRLPAGTPVTVRDYVAMTAKVGVTSVVSMLNYRADLYIVAVFLPAAALGLYTVAVSAAESLLVPTQVAALVTSPHIGGLDHAAAARLAARCVRNNMLVAVVVCAVLFVVAPWVVQLFYGAAFLPLVPALRVLLVGVLALSLGSPVSSYYTLKLGKPEIPLTLAGASAAVCIAVAIVLVPHFGIVGAAIASTVAYVVGQGLGLGYFARRTGVGMASMLVPRRDDFAIYYRYARSFGRPSEGLGKSA